MVIWNETVSASNVGISISGNTATATYIFEDTADVAESGSTYQWYRTSSTTALGTAISGATSKTYTLTPSDNQKYLNVCVTPSTGYLSGSQVCSTVGNTNTGDLLMIYKDGSYSGSSLALAYERSPSGTCFNLTDYSFNDMMSSFKWPIDWSNNYYGSAATLTLYKDVGCSGTSTSYSTSYGTSASSLGSTWNDIVSSVKVDWTSLVSISKPAVTISGNKATQSHTYTDGANTTENTTYQWYRNGSATDTNKTAISGATGSSYTLTLSDNDAYLQVCATPANISTIGTQVCSDWAKVGHLVWFYSQQSTSSSTDTSIGIAYERSASGTCFNMSDYDFDDIARAFVLYSGTSSAATLTYYQAADCVSDSSKAEWALTVSTNGSGVVYNTTNAGYVSSSSGFAYAVNMGALFDNTVSSFKVTY
jgi:hypothetical protein